MAWSRPRTGRSDRCASAQPFVTAVPETNLFYRQLWYPPDLAGVYHEVRIIPQTRFLIYAYFALPTKRRCCRCCRFALSRRAQSGWLAGRLTAPTPNATNPRNSHACHPPRLRSHRAAVRLDGGLPHLRATDSSVAHRPGAGVDACSRQVHRQGLAQQEQRGGRRGRGRGASTPTGSVCLSVCLSTRRICRRGGVTYVVSWHDCLVIPPHSSATFWTSDYCWCPPSPATRRAVEPAVASDPIRSCTRQN